MGLLSAALKTAIQAGGTPVWLLELSLPGGTKRMAIPPYQSAASGLYEPTIIQWSGFTRSAERNSLESIQATCEVDDQGNVLGAILEGPAGHQVWNSAVAVKVAEAGVLAASWLQEFGGVLLTAKITRPGVWQLSFRTNDLPLNQPLPRTIIGPGDWPSADPRVWGQAAPYLLGKHSGYGVLDTGGACTALNVDRQNFRHMACYGRALAIDEVFKDGVIVLTGYSVVYVTVNGRLYTLIDFTTDQGDAVITFNGRGYDTNNDGTGTLIEGDPDILKHVLVQFGFSDHPGFGAWYGDSTAPIDATSWAALATFFTARGYKGSRYIAGSATRGPTGVSDDRPTGRALLDEFCDNLEVQPYWTGTGKIALGVFDPGAFGYVDDPLIRQEDEIASGQLAIDYPDDGLADRIEGSLTYMESTSSYAQQLAVHDVNVGRLISEPVSLRWSPSWV